ncbi:MAG TPA: hypothetical protein VE377_24465 [Candidatus Dormibacteraeota bacterium]|nr:hypothetical protein [Candidatus Dormibacteraeota bacterium]
MSTSSSRNPLELVDRYLQAVRFWLPKGQQDDLTAELGEDLRSQIDEKEAEVGRPLEKAEISEILKRCGAPMVVASRLRPKRYLIGPTLFPIYEFVLKMVLLWILVPVFIFIVGPANLANNNGDWGKAVLFTLGNLWSGAFIAAGTITLVFAVLERTHAIADVACKWDPSSLPPLQKPERKTSSFQTACELWFNVFGLVWLLLIPQHPFLIFGPAAAFLKLGPIWHTFYLPIVLLAAAVIVRSAVTLAKPQWTAFPLWTQLLQSGLMLILVHYMIEAAGQTVQGSWHPFVVIADGVRNSEQYVRFTKIVAIVNVSLLISLACTWVGVSIGGAVQTWQLLKYVRNQRAVSPQAASLQVR